MSPNFGTNQLPDSRDGQLRRLKEGRLRLPFGKNDLHF
jgi:hypothetical protein